ncbi:MAG: GNAT family N-acetyltransferase [Reyranella sp.]|nr:GNAT family N-acetyltransferase [Reyranella sp.]
MEIVDFAALAPARHADAARILRGALAHVPSAYNGHGEAEAEVALRCGDDDWLGYAALEGGGLVGWIGAIRTYSHGWEIHPLVVAPDQHYRCIGSALMAALEARARSEGVLTLFLGSDDDYGGTTLFGRDLGPDVVGNIATIQMTGRRHPLTFYRRHGYEVVGLLPDVNGAGRPDIMLAKRLTTSRSSA